MTRIDLPYNSERQFTMELVEEARAAELSIAWVERLHIGFTSLSILLVLCLCFERFGQIGYATAAAVAVLCLTGLLLSQAVRVLLADFYRQFQHREKFALFLIHVAIVVVPYFFLNLRVHGQLFAYSTVLSILLVALSFQAIDPLFHGRIHFVTALLALLACHAANPPPPPLMICAWFAAFLLAIRFNHVNFRIMEHGEERGVDLRGTVLRSFPIPLLAALSGLVVYVAASGLFQRRAFPQGVLPFRSESAQPLRMDSSTQVLWQAFSIVVIIICVLVLMKWIDEKLRRHRRAEELELDITGSSTRAFRIEDIAEDPLAMDVAAGTRDRILTAFRRFSETMSRLGLGRAEVETIEGYFARLGRAHPDFEPLEGAGTGPFETACYDTHEPSPADADTFVSALDESLRGFRRRNESGRERGRPGSDQRS